MKKLAFLFVAIAAITFASCGNKAATTNEVVEEPMLEEVVPVEVVEIAAENDSVAAEEVLVEGEVGEIVSVEEVAE